MSSNDELEPRAGKATMSQQLADHLLAYDAETLSLKFATALSLEFLCAELDAIRERLARVEGENGELRKRVANMEVPSGL